MAVRPRVRPRAGFTLVELVVVMVIAVVLLGLTVPGFVKVIARYQSESAARRMVADLRETRELARMENTSYEIQFFTAADRYHVKRFDSLTARQRVPLPGPVDLEHAGFGASGSVLRFNAHGEPNWNGTVTLKNRVTGERRYVIVSKSGRVRVSDVSAAE
ncbi:MAG: GspH/FimT family pseudopilin [Bacillota bacterium]